MERSFPHHNPLHANQNKMPNRLLLATEAPFAVMLQLVKAPKPNKLMLLDTTPLSSISKTPGMADVQLSQHVQPAQLAGQCSTD